MSVVAFHQKASSNETVLGISDKKVLGLKTPYL
jgi:hypothetical protein